jgi:uncharacterized membrane protein YbhN (UPF0104 family)
MSRRWSVLRVLGGVLVLSLVAWRFGTGPFAEAWRVTTWGSVGAALLLTALATVANAWRWRLVARALGAPIPVGASVAAYCRSQLLNVTLPGGILGDAHRGLRHGRASGDLGVGLRATVWDRAIGQLVQAIVLVLVLLLLPTPLRVLAPTGVAGLGGVLLLACWLGRRGGPLAFAGRDLRAMWGSRVAIRVVVASVASTACHLAVLAVAVATVGVDPGPAVFLAIGLVVLVGSAVPVNVAGWGPREGVAAGAFALAGLGSSAGLTVSVVFGVLSAVATVPGLLVLGGDLVVRRRRAAAPAAARTLEDARRG